MYLETQNSHMLFQMHLQNMHYKMNHGGLHFQRCSRVKCETHGKYGCSNIWNVGPSLFCSSNYFVKPRCLSPFSGVIYFTVMENYRCILIFCGFFLPVQFYLIDCLQVCETLVTGQCIILNLVIVADNIHYCHT